MLHVNFKNYEEFKRLYVREDGKRKNGILLAFTTSKKVFEWYRKREELEMLYSIDDMNKLFDELVYMHNQVNYGCELEIGQHLCLKSHEYGMDSQKGLCFDNDIDSYRYVRNGRPYKKRVGRLVGAILGESEWGQTIPEQCKLWLCEEISGRWRTWAQSQVNDLRLVVDDDFESIYDRHRYENERGMGSCMENDGFHTFYEDAVDASAASLRRSNGAILARCVIYNEAKQYGTDKVFRLCERQYAVDGNELYKRLLVAKLIAEGMIDAYKPVGAGCHEPRSWLDTQDKPLNETRFSILCKLSDGDTVSYQDSFKFFDEDLQIAYNYRAEGANDEAMESTEGIYRGNRYYDSWNDCYEEEEMIVCYANGHQYQTTEYEIERNFRWVDGLCEYHHCDDVHWCDCCNVWVLNDDVVYSELLEEYFCSQSCCDDAEEEYRKEHPEEE